MVKAIGAACAILLCSSLAIAAGVTVNETQPRGALTVEPSGVMMGISEEERERRVQVCEREWESCMDWCNQTKGGSGCRSKCSDKLGDCMKKIPYPDKD